MGDFEPCLVPPSLPPEESRGGLSSTSVLLDTTAYLSADAVSNDTTAAGKLSNGKPIQVSFCLARPPRLSYLCVHFPGPAAVPAASFSFLSPGTPAARCTMVAPRVLSSHADLALLLVTHPGFCIGCPHPYRDIAVVKLSDQQDMEIKYVEMGVRPGEDLPLPPSRQSVDRNSDDPYAYSESDDEEEYDVAPYWNANVWILPAPVASASWKDWHRDKDCRVDVTDIVVDNPKHSELLLPLPRLSTDPKNATMSLRRLLTAHPTLGLGEDGDVVIYLLSKVDYMDSKGWVIAVGARDKKLRGIAELDSRKNNCFMRYYHVTEISKYLTKATGEVGPLIRAGLSQKEEMQEDSGRFSNTLLIRAN